jgi:hypothetical protein
LLPSVNSDFGYPVILNAGSGPCQQHCIFFCACINILSVQDSPAAKSRRHAGLKGGCKYRQQLLLLSLKIQQVNLPAQQQIPVLVCF